MKRFSYGLLLATILFGFSCTNDPTGAGADDTPPQPQNHRVSVESAVAELQSALEGIDAETRAGTPRKVGSITAVKAGNVIPATRSGETPQVEDLVYIANFENDEGYAILAADDRLAPVIAITDQGNATPGEFIAVARGEYAKYGAMPVTPEVIAYTMSAAQPYITVDPWITKEYGLWTMKTSTIPLLMMKWDQNVPYNMYCPLVQNKYGQSVKAPVGCVAVAIGQIVAYNAGEMNFYSDPDIGGYNVDWPLIYKAISNAGIVAAGKNRSFPHGDRSPEALAVATYLRAVGAAVGMEYYASGSHPGSMDQVVSFLSYMGAKNPSLTDYSYSRVYSMVVNHQLPVYVQGFETNDLGHAWVIDGVCEQKRIVYIYNISGIEIGTGEDTRTLFHCNYGYGGLRDGYYASQMFDLENGPEAQDPRGDTDITADGDDRHNNNMWTECIYNLNNKIITYTVQ